MEWLDNLPRWLAVVVWLFGIFLALSWLLLPLVVMIGLDRIRKVLLQIRDGEHGLSKPAERSVFPAEAPQSPTRPPNALYGKVPER